MNFTKLCSACKRELSLVLFRKQKGTKDGYQYECRECGNARAKNRYHAKKDDVAEANKAWLANHPISRAKINARYYQAKAKAARKAAREAKKLQEKPENAPSPV